MEWPEALGKFMSTSADHFGRCELNHDGGSDASEEPRAVTRVKQTKRLSWGLGLASTLLMALGYPGGLLVRWSWWALVMVPFCFVVFLLVVGLTRPQASKRPARHPPLSSR